MDFIGLWGVWSPQTSLGQLTNKKVFKKLSQLIFKCLAVNTIVIISDSLGREKTKVPGLF